MKIAGLQTSHRRRANFTPMIDVVFLLLIFFMMISRFGDSQGMPLALAGQGGDTWSGPPRLVTIAMDGLRLNGVPTTLSVLAEELRPLMAASSDAILVQPTVDVSLQPVVDVFQALRRAGLTGLVLVE